LAKFLFKYATRSRPRWFKETLAKWRSMLSGLHDYYWLISIDEDDPSMNNPEMLDYLGKIQNLKVCIGSSKNKIQAINDGMDKAQVEWEILVVVSDDMSPVVSGFDDIIFKDMQSNFPSLSNEFDGALFYNDGRAGQSVCCLTIMGRKLYDRFGYIYWPAYKSNWADNEYTDACRALVKIVYIDKVIIRHDWMKNGYDQLYTRNLNKADWIYDSYLYKTRKKCGFPAKYSQHFGKDEDVILEFFKDFVGRFLDIGAHDGVTFSNTRALFEAGWSGVMVEPSPSVFPILKENYEVFRESGRIFIEDSALWHEEGIKDFYDACGDLVSSFNEQHVEVWRKTHPFKKVAVKTITWEKLLSKYGSDFDFLNIDIEGETYPILKKIPDSILRNLKMICYEKSESFSNNDGEGEIVSRLNDNKFSFVSESEGNKFFAKKP